MRTYLIESQDVPLQSWSSSVSVWRVLSSVGTGAAAARAVVRRRVRIVGMCIFGGRWDCI